MPTTIEELIKQYEAAGNAEMNWGIEMVYNRIVADLRALQGTAAPAGWRYPERGELPPVNQPVVAVDEITRDGLELYTTARWTGSAWEWWSMDSYGWRLTNQPVRYLDPRTIDAPGQIDAPGTIGGGVAGGEGWRYPEKDELPDNLRRVEIVCSYGTSRTKHFPIVDIGRWDGEKWEYWDDETWSYEPLTGIAAWREFEPPNNWREFLGVPDDGFRFITPGAGGEVVG